MYKHPQLRKLAAYLRSHPELEQVEWHEVWQFYVKHHRERSKLSPGPKQPAPYQSRVGAINSRARKVGAEGTLTAADLEDVMASGGSKCAHCGTQHNLVFDHIIPYYRGGSNTKENLQVLCRLCNMEKGVSTPKI